MSDDSWIDYSAVPLFIDRFGPSKMQQEDFDVAVAASRRYSKPVALRLGHDPHVEDVKGGESGLTVFREPIAANLEQRPSTSFACC